jgi:nucleotide-binding universal stress UspA family protein
MTSSRLPRSVLVPILDGDITEGTLAHARSALADPDARLALVHVVSARDGTHGSSSRHARPDDGGVARWRRLAACVRPGHVFVDAVSGDPADVIPSQIDRFGSDLVVVGRPRQAGATGAWVDRVIARVLRAAPGRVLVAVEREPETAAPGRARPHGTRRNDADRCHASRRAAPRQRARPQVG